MVYADFARELERELADCRRTCAELVTDGNAVTLAQSVQRLSAENAALRDERATALDALGYGKSCDPVRACGYRIRELAADARLLDALGRHVEFQVHEHGQRAYCAAGRLRLA